MTVIYCSFCESSRALADKKTTEIGHIGSFSEHKWFTQMDCWSEPFYYKGRLIEKVKAFFCSPLCHANWMIQQRTKPSESLKTSYKLWFESHVGFDDIEKRTFELIDSFENQPEITESVTITPVPTSS
jgi:hypothetical protein